MDEAEEPEKLVTLGNTGDKLKIIEWYNIRIPEILDILGRTDLKFSFDTDCQISDEMPNGIPDRMVFCLKLSCNSNIFVEDQFILEDVNQMIDPDDDGNYPVAYDGKLFLVEGRMMGIIQLQSPHS
jgi:hypothetical protein